MNTKSMGQGSPRLGHWVGVTFRVGLYSSLIMIAVGFVWFAAAGRASPEEIALERLVSSLLAGEPGAMISLGVLVLMMTPFAVVIVSLVRFMIDRNWSWVAVSLLLLAILALAVYKGLR